MYRLDELSTEICNKLCTFLAIGLEHMNGQWTAGDGGQARADGNSVRT